MEVGRRPVLLPFCYHARLNDPKYALRGRTLTRLTVKAGIAGSIPVTSASTNTVPAQLPDGPSGRVDSSVLIPIGGGIASAADPGPGGHLGKWEYHLGVPPRRSDSAQAVL